MTAPTITVTITVEADATNLEHALNRLADALARPAGADLKPEPELGREVWFDATNVEDAVARPTAFACDAPGCDFASATRNGLGPHRRARHPELVGRPTTPAPARPLASVPDDRTIDIGPVTAGKPIPKATAAPVGHPPQPRPATYNPTLHRCGCGAAFAFAFDLRRHRIAENHHPDDEVDGPDEDGAA